MKKYIKYIAIILLAIIAFGNINNVHAKTREEKCKNDNDCKIVCEKTFTQTSITENIPDGSVTDYEWRIYHYNKSDKWYVEVLSNKSGLTNVTSGSSKQSFDNTFEKKGKIGDYRISIPNKTTRKELKDNEKCPGHSIVYLGVVTMSDHGDHIDEIRASHACLADNIEDCTKSVGEQSNKKITTAITAENGESVQIVLPQIDEVDDSCEGILDDEATEFIRKLLTFVRYGGVIIALLLSTLDLIKAVSSGSQEDLTKAMKRFGKRMIFAALLFFVALIVGILLDIFGITVAEGCSL